MEMISNYIAGAQCPPVAGRYLDNVNPATGEVYGKIPRSDAADVDLAVAAAKKAFPAWSQLPAQERAKPLFKLSELITANLERLAMAETIDNGKPIALARSLDIPRSSENLRFFADLIENFAGETFSDQGKGKNSVHYSPLGVVACISPWNLPLYLFTWKIAPALAAGCTVVAKPSEVTPLTAFLLGQLCQEAGLPPGVLNIVHGTGPEVGTPLTTHPGVKAVSFTGSSATGKMVAKAAAESMKRCSLELGGKNPNIIFADCDFEQAVTTTVRSSFLNQGQICLCGSRIFIQRPLYEKFKLALIEQTKALKQGDPQNSETQQGAVVSKAHYQKILSCLEKAREEGGTFLTGGSAAKLSGPNAKGFFITPTLIEGLGPECSTNREEIFGPVATLMPFDTENEVVGYANSTDYGLAASVWSQDLAKAERVASQIDSGVVWINCWMQRDLRTPFGGMKGSGMGREGGRYSLAFFSNIKTIGKG